MFLRRWPFVKKNLQKESCAQWRSQSREQTKTPMTTCVDDTQSSTYYVLPSDFDDDLEMNELRKKDENDIGVFLMLKYAGVVCCQKRDFYGEI